MTMTVKPLGALTKRPSGTSSANPKTGKSFVESPQPKHKTTPASIDNYEHHSKHRGEASKHYHQEVVGKQDTGQYGDRAIERLNPNKAAPGVRSFPGLANG
jgi:hypothetical protein